MRNFVHPGQPPVVIRYGAFIQTVIYFIIVSLVLFLVIQSFNKLRRLAAKKKVEQQSTELNQVNEELKVLKEIRDLLAKKPDVQYGNEQEYEHPHEL